MNNEISQEYSVLTERLEEIRWAIGGSCDAYGLGNAIGNLSIH